MTENKSPATISLVFILSFTLLAWGIFIQGFSIAWLWQWFMTPFGLPSIKFAHALGLSVLLNLIMSDVAKEKSPEIANMSELEIILHCFLKITCKGIIVLGIGFVISRFM